jgi:hypothetical protein
MTYRVPRTACRVRRVALAIVFSLTAPTIGSAQQNRESLLGKDGLILGFGIGGGLASIRTEESVESGTTTSGTTTEPALAGDFKFGSGLSERVLIYWFGKSALYNGPEGFGAGTKTATVLAISGIGASYFIARRVGVGGGIGAASLTWNRQTDWGLGLAVGTEYEFARHWLIGVDVIYGTPKPDEPPGVDRSVTTFVVKATLNWLYY